MSVHRQVSTVVSRTVRGKTTTTRTLRDHTKRAQKTLARLVGTRRAQDLVAAAGDHVKRC